MMPIKPEMRMYIMDENLMAKSENAIMQTRTVDIIAMGRGFFFICLKSFKPVEPIKYTTHA
jgi:hypothetical protein